MALVASESSDDQQELRQAIRKRLEEMRDSVSSTQHGDLVVLGLQFLTHNEFDLAECVFDIADDKSLYATLNYAQVYLHKGEKIPQHLKDRLASHTIPAESVVQLGALIIEEEWEDAQKLLKHLFESQSDRDWITTQAWHWPILGLLKPHIDSGLRDRIQAEVKVPNPYSLVSSARRPTAALRSGTRPT
jgi:hypothetical protein